MVPNCGAGFFGGGGTGFGGGGGGGGVTTTTGSGAGGGATTTGSGGGGGGGGSGAGTGFAGSTITGFFAALICAQPVKMIAIQMNILMDKIKYRRLDCIITPLIDNMNRNKMKNLSSRLAYRYLKCQNLDMLFSYIDNRQLTTTNYLIASREIPGIIPDNREKHIELPRLRFV